MRGMGRVTTIKRTILVIILILAGILLVKLLETEPSPKQQQAKRRIHKNQEEYIDRKGIRVIVGHYKGEAAPGVNFTKEELDLNRYSPVAGAGENGQPVHLRSHQQILSGRLWHMNQFNLVVSDSISVDRTLPDVRSEECRALNYDLATLPATSVIVVFHNEAWSTLVRTIHSVINNTPNHLIQEIVLVDDASDREYLRGELEAEVSALPVHVNIIRSSTRVGLIKARLVGAKAAKGSVLTFLDAHCECTPGWIQPLLLRIRESPSSVVCPVIDILNDDTFQYTKSFALHWGAFNWELHFRWFTMGIKQINKRRDNSTASYGSPVMAGGLFSINADYFWSVGSYDEQMDIWGGENLEMSLRVWQCGGRVEISPCSRVGHVFRKASPYTFPGGVSAILNANLARLAKTWMDDYAKFYFKMNSRAMKAAATQDVSERLELREKLKCKSFDWYLDNVWPENFFPRPGQFFGKLRLKSEEKCLQKPRRQPGSQSSQPNGPALLDSCVDSEMNTGQLVTMNKVGNIMGDESVCLDVPTWQEEDAGVRFSSCNEIERQIWSLETAGKVGGKEVVEVIHKLSGRCLSLATGATSDAIILRDCSTADHWVKEPQTW